jgi:aspartate carbamoyltransferase catalytic subunit
VQKGESLLDTLRNIEAMKIDVVVVRHKGTGVPNILADNSKAIIF